MAKARILAMKLFLIIVGALVTGFAICLLLLTLWLRRLARKVFGSVEDQLDDLNDQLSYSIPPPRIKLVRLEAIEWQHGDEVRTIEETLRQARFEEIGDFRIEPTKVLLRAFCKPVESTYARCASITRTPAADAERRYRTRDQA